MKVEEIKELMKAMEESGLTSFDYNEGNMSLSLRRGEVFEVVSGGTEHLKELSAPKVKPETKEEKAPEEGKEPAPEKEAEGKVIFSPLVGTFYAAPSPDDEPYVSVGSVIKKGDVLGIIEAMKLMNEIESEYDGNIEAVLVENGQMVEYGQALFRIS